MNEHSHFPDHTLMHRHRSNPTLDLVLERIVDVPPARLFAGWTQPALLTQWFTPAPWQTVAAEVDLRPGGKFHTVMRSPEGEEFPNTGCILEVVPDRTFAWTGALLPDYRPRPAQEITTEPFLMSARIDLEPHGNGGTRYVATAIHGDEESRKKHEAMGFHGGWGMALDQLVALIKRG